MSPINSAEFTSRTCLLQDQPLGNWRLKRQVDEGDEVIYKFSPKFTLKAGQSVTVRIMKWNRMCMSCVPVKKRQVFSTGFIEIIIIITAGERNPLKDIWETEQRCVFQLTQDNPQSLMWTVFIVQERVSITIWPHWMRTCMGETLNLEMKHRCRFTWHAHEKHQCGCSYLLTWMLRWKDIMPRTHAAPAANVAIL